VPWARQSGSVLALAWDDSRRGHQERRERSRPECQQPLHAVDLLRYFMVRRTQRPDAPALDAIEAATDGVSDGGTSAAAATTPAARSPRPGAAILRRASPISAAIAVGGSRPPSRSAKS
jgi:hypothetical protein